MSAAIGVTIASRTVLSVTWPDAWVVMSPGGRPGAARRTTIGVATTLNTSQAIRIRRRWFGSRIVDRRSGHLHEAVHVADRRHRPAEPGYEACRARDEALPAKAAGLAGAE